jgi:hypothetical protein
MREKREERKREIYTGIVQVAHYSSGNVAHGFDRRIGYAHSLHYL